MKQHGITIKNEAIPAGARLAKNSPPAAAPLSHRLRVWACARQPTFPARSHVGACPAAWNPAPLRCAGMAREEVLFGAFFDTLKPVHKLVNILRLGVAPAGQFCRPTIRTNLYTALHYPPYRNLQARPALEPLIAKHSWVVRAARIGPQAIARLTATSRPSRTVISKTRRWSFSNLAIPENTAWVLHCRVS